MNNTITDEYALNIVDDLFVKIGVHENLNTEKILNQTYSLNLEQKIELISLCLGLPVKINILQKTNNYDNSAAKVTIPDNVPLYGSEKMVGFPITIELNKTQMSNISFVTVIAHELSHVLLASIKSDKKTNEFYTDTVPLMLGFINIVNEGRKVINYVEYSGDTKINHTTTFGYLDDHKFYIIKEKINKKLSEYKKEKQKLKNRLNILKKKLKKTEKQISFIKRLFAFFNKNIKYIKIEKGDENSFRNFYINSDYFNNLEKELSTLEYDLYETDIDLFNLVHYFQNTIKIFDNKIKILENKEQGLYNNIFNNILLFKKYISFFKYYFILISKK